MKIKYFLISALLCGFVSGIQAQSDVTTMGGEYKTDGGFLNFTVGQVSVAPISTDGEGSIEPGIITLLQVIALDVEEEFVAMSVFPNPSTDFVSIQFDETQRSLSSYSIFNQMGQKLKTGLLTEKKTDIDLSDLASNIYFLKVSNQLGQVKNFKIVKINKP